MFSQYNEILIIDSCNENTEKDLTVFFCILLAAFVLSCNFPERPAYGDVTVSSLHAGGEAFFYCFTGYQLQGPSTLTCLNATTPYWSEKEPRCLGE